MLPADKALVARDWRIPGLAAALDAVNLAEGLDRVLPAAGVTSASLSYVRYKPGTSCVAAGVAHTPAGEISLWVKAFRHSDAARAHRLADGARIPVAAGRGGVLLPDGATAVVFLPNERALRAVAVLHDEGRRRRRLRAAFDGRADLPVLTPAPTPLRHKPERRWVARLGGQLLVKVYAAGEFPRALLAARMATPGVPRPELVGVNPAARMLLWRWVDGEPLGAVSPAVQADLVEALVRLHRGDGGALPPVDQPAAVLAACGAVAGVAPELRGRADTVARQVGTHLARLAPTTVTVHGDLTADQVVVGDGVTLLDFDNAAAGDPAVDLASLAIDGGGCPRVLADAYRAAGGSADDHAVTVHAAAWHLRHALDGFRRRLDDWPELLCRRLHAAEALLESL